MYRPPLSAETRPEVLHQAMQAIGLATLVTPTETEIHATQIPFLLRPQPGGGLRLAGHCARANPHWRVAEGARSLVLFHGPQAYLSPSWYPTKAETGKVVPTWLYVTIHAHGRLRAVQERDWLLAQVSELTDRHEAGQPAPWQVADAPAAYIEAMCRGIVGLEVEVERLEGAWKLNEEEPERDRQGTLAALRSADGPARQLGEALAQRLQNRE